MTRQRDREKSKRLYPFLRRRPKFDDPEIEYVEVPVPEYVTRVLGGPYISPMSFRSPLIQKLAFLDPLLIPYGKNCIMVRDIAKTDLDFIVISSYTTNVLAG